MRDGLPRRAVTLGVTADVLHAHRLRKWNGWGYEGEEPAPERIERWRQTTGALAGVRAEDYRAPVPLEQLTLPPPRLRLDPAADLPGFQGRIVATAYERALHAAGRSTGDLIRLRTGTNLRFPDAVAYPTCEDDLLRPRVRRASAGGPDPHRRRELGGRFTFIARPPREEIWEAWREIQRVALEAFLEHGATLSHHHGTGRDFAPFFEREHGPGHVAALRALKAHLDPAGCSIRACSSRDEGGDEGDVAPQVGDFVLVVD